MTVAGSWWLVASSLTARRPSNQQQATSNEGFMTLDYGIGLLVTAFLLVYLTYALLRPERF